VYNFEKYNPKYSSSLLIFSWIHLVALLLFISYLFANIAEIGSPGIFIYGLFIFLSVYAYTELMDRNPYSLFWETLKNIVGCFIIYKTGDWFNASTHIAWINYVIIGWFFISTFGTAWFSLIEFRSEKTLNVA
ncbi:MAG: sterol desaturase, partial [Chitinophagaceae bacterium]